MRVSATSPVPRSTLAGDAAIAFALAIGASLFYRIAWPAAPGRDFSTYVYYYVDMWTSAPTYTMLMAYRTPLTPLFIGGLTELGGAPLVAIAMATCYAIVVASTYLVGAFWHRQAGWVAAAALILYPGYAGFFHEIGSDMLFGTAFMAWAAAICWTTTRQTPRAYALHAVCVCVLTLIRPVGQCFLSFMFFPWVVPHLATRARIRCSLAFLTTAVALLAVWSTYNAVRYDDFTVSRGGGAITPLYRILTVERIVRPENGPASAELARAVEADLLTHEPYVSYGVDERAVFAAAGPRIWSDFVALSDRTFGWRSDHALLRRVAFEALRAHPGPYVRDVAHDLAAMLGLTGYGSAAPGAPPPASPPAPPVMTTPVLPPVPTKGQLIPYSYVWWLASSPDGHRPPEVMPNEARVRRITDALRYAVGSPTLAKALNRAGQLFPPPIVWLIVGCAGTWTAAGLRPRVLLALVGLAAPVLLASVAGQDLVFQYRFPFDPLFIAFGAAGFVRDGLRRPAEPS